MKLGLRVGLLCVHNLTVAVIHLLTAFFGEVGDLPNLLLGFDTGYKAEIPVLGGQLGLIGLSHVQRPCFFIHLHLAVLLFD